MKEASTTEEDVERLIEAAAWRARLTEAGLETSPEFESWLAEEGNQAAWRRLCAPLQFLDQYASEAESLAIRASALTHARKTTGRRDARRERLRIVGAVAATLLIAVTGSAGWLWLSNRPDDYATALGERRVIALQDGSKVSLDSNSEVTVHYSQRTRELQLLRGQARFDVAHDVQRPFSVVARDQTVVATGTAFNIDLAGPRVLVTLIEGHVVVLKTSPSARTPIVAVQPKRDVVELRAGQELAAVPQSPPIVEAANIQKITAWTNGQLVFEDEPLREVVDRVNRYTDTPVTIDDLNTAQLKISGVFNTGDVAGFVQIVTKFLPLDAAEQDGRIHLRKKS